MSILLALAAALPCTTGGEFEPPLCPAGLPVVTSLRIESRGVSRWQVTGEPPCRAFRPTYVDVRRFFRQARRAERAEVHYTLPESACVATGTIRFADGSRGRWQIDRFALGWLDRPGHDRLTLYCRQCRSRPWMQ